MRPSTRLLMIVGPIVVSVLVWVSLWSDLSFTNVLWGIVLGLLLQRLVPVRISEEGARISIIGAIRYAAYLVWSLFESSAVVAWEVVTPGSRLSQGIVAVPLRTSSDVVATVVANSITLTPGAMTLEVAQNPTVLYVHVMHLRSLDDVRAEVHHLEDLVLKVFPDAKAAATIPDLNVAKSLEEQS